MTATAEGEEEAAASFSALRERLRADGCFDHAPAWSIASLVLHVALALATWQLASVVHPVVAVPVFALGSFFFYRLGWLMHDAAHSATFATAAGNQAFAALTAGILGEFPSGWRYGHNRHHAAPNVRGKDMDQSERWDETRRYRTWLGAVVGVLLLSKYKGRYLPKTLILLGLRDGYFCFHHSRHRFRRELAACLVSYAVQLAVFSFFFSPLAAPFLFFAHTVVGMLYLNTVFAGNHYDRESFDEEGAAALDFAALQVRTARNYAGGALARYVFGGLEHQIEHHLFPAMPRHALVRAAPHVRAFCAARGLPYEVLPFTECLRRILRFHVVK